MNKEADVMLRSITKQLCELLVISKNMEQINTCQDEVLFGRLTNDFVAKCENLTYSARRFAIKNYTAPTEILLNIASQIQGISVRKDTSRKMEDGWMDCSRQDARKREKNI